MDSTGRIRQSPPRRGLNRLRILQTHLRALRQAHNRTSRVRGDFGLSNCPGMYALPPRRVGM